MTARISLSLLMLAILQVGSAFGQSTFTWSVNGDGTWGSPPNWGGFGTPSTGDTALFSNFNPTVDPPPPIAPSAFVNLEGTKVARNVSFLQGNTTTVFTIGNSVQTLELNGGDSSSISRAGSANTVFTAAVNLIGTGKTMSVANSNSAGTLGFRLLNIGDSNALTISGVGTTNVTTLSGSGAASSVAFTGLGSSTLSTISNIATIDVQGEGSRSLGTVTGVRSLSVSGSGTTNFTTVTGTGASAVATFSGAGNSTLSGISSVGTINVEGGTRNLGAINGVSSLNVSGTGTTNFTNLTGTGAAAIASFSGAGSSTGTSIASIGTINVSGGTRTFGTINGASAINLTGGSLNIGALNTIGTNTTSINVTGGNHSITAVDRANISLSGTGSIASSIAVSNNSSLGGSGVINGNVTVSSGSVLSGTSTINGNVAIQTGAIHSPGNSPGIQTIAGNLTYAAGSTFVWELNGNSVNPADYDQVVFSGAARTLTVNGLMNTRLNFVGANFNNPFWSDNRTWTVFSNVVVNQDSIDDMNIVIDTPGAPNGTLAWVFDGSNNNLNLQFSAVPEPGTLALLGLVTGLFGVANRRKIKAMIVRG